MDKEVNKRQKDFYQSFKKNSITQLWYKLRNGLFKGVRDELKLNEIIYSTHKEWFGDLSDKKVLDLGCYAGNVLSFYLATNSKEYTGIDLSENAISILEKEIKNIPKAKVYAVDFLSEEFKEKDFDLIYAYGVLHHFKDLQVLIDKLKEKLNDNGLIISYDPLNTNYLVRFARGLYRPFQSDKDWEWPFTKETLNKYDSSFRVVERRGLLGRTKWFFLLKLLPIGENKRNEIVTRWQIEDWKKSSKSIKYLTSCMQVTMLLQKKTL